MAERDDRLTIMAALTRLLAQSTEARIACTAIAEAAVRVLTARVARVWVNDPARTELTVGGSYGIDPTVERDLLDFTQIAHGEGIPGRIAETRTPEYIADAKDDPRWVNVRFVRALGLRAYAGLPLVIGDSIVGVLSILFDQPHLFTHDDRLLIEALGHHAALVIHNARLFEQAERRRHSAEAAEAALRTSEAKFRALVALAPDAIIIADADGRIVLANTQARQLFGYAEEEMLGQPVEMLLPEAARQAHETHRASYTAAPRTRPMGVGLELAGRRKDGAEFPVEVSLAPMPSDEGSLVISVIRDITDRKRLEADQRAMLELQAIAKLANAAAHEINNPLTVIVARLGLLANQLPDDRRVEAMQQAADRIAAIVRQMRGVMRVRTVETSANIPAMLDVAGSSDTRSADDRAGGASAKPISVSGTLPGSPPPGRHDRVIPLPGRTPYACATDDRPSRRRDVRGDAAPHRAA